MTFEAASAENDNNGNRTAITASRFAIPRLTWLLAALLAAGAVAHWVLHSGPVEANVGDEAPESAMIADPPPALWEPVVLHDHPAANAATEPQPLPWKRYTVKSGDSLSALFHRAGFTPAALQRVLALGKQTQALSRLRPGDSVELRANHDGSFAGLRYATGPLDTLVVEANDDGLAVHTRHLEPTRRTVIASGTVHSTLTGAMRGAGVEGEIVARFARIFRWKLNFSRDLRAGARFVVVYDKLFRNGEPVGVGVLRAAELDNRGRTLRAYRFGEGEDARYFDTDGHSLKPSLLRTPVRYSRVSSPFSLRRWHPLLHVWRPHYGVDLAADIGTPIKAAGDGTIRRMVRGPGYGRLVTIKHFGPYSTRYAHLRRFAKGIHVGSRVHQGQVIGYVGESGEATGPHLHFEIRVDGKPKDPLHVALPDGTPVPKQQRAQFRASIAPLTAALEDPDRYSTPTALASLGLDHEAQNDAGEQQIARAGSDTP